MRKIIFHLSTGYAGMDETENVLVSEDTTNEELDLEAWERAVAHAESYGISPESDLEDMDSEDYNHLLQSGEIDNYSSNIEGYWEDYVPEKHDMLKPGGGDWKWR